MAESEQQPDLLTASLEALDRYRSAQEALAEGGDRPPAPGDVYVLEATGDFDVEWAILAHDPADASRFLLVPADGHVLAGSADVELGDDSPVGSLTLRCRFATWAGAELLRPDLRVGVLGSEDLARVRRRWLEVGDGKETGDVLGREVDDDPGYQDWTRGVLVPARQALIEAHGAEEAPREIAANAGEPKARPAAPLMRRFSVSAFLPIAASIVVAVMGVQLWRLSEQVRDLETEKASEVVNPVIAFFSPPKEARRSKVVVTLRPEQSYILLLLALREPSPAPRYRLEVRAKGIGTMIWSSDRLVVQKPGEIRAGLPAEVLKQGEYELELLAREGDTFRRVGEYELVVLDD